MINKLMTHIWEMSKIFCDAKSTVDFLSSVLKSTKLQQGECVKLLCNQARAHMECRHCTVLMKTQTHTPIKMFSIFPADLIKVAVRWYFNSLSDAFHEGRACQIQWYYSALFFLWET